MVGISLKAGEDLGKVHTNREERNLRCLGSLLSLSDVAGRSYRSQR